jgi:hypothetical protein
LQNNPTAILNGVANLATFTGTTTSAATCTLTANFSGAISEVAMVAGEAHGQGTSQPDQAPAASPNGNTYANYTAANAISSTTVTDSHINDLAYGFLVFSSSGPTFAAGTSPNAWTLQLTEDKLAIETATISGTSAQATGSQSVTANTGFAAAAIVTVHP